MSVVSLLNVDVKNNPAPFAAPYEFEITFECLEPLQKDLEWKVMLNFDSSEHDQVLDTLLVGPVPVGVNKFVFETEAPDLSKIPNTEIVGVTVVLLSCAYDDREFVRVGYYVNNEYVDEALIADPPSKPVIDKVRRVILAEKPRVTRFAIKWDSEESAPAEFPPEQPEADALDDDEGAYGAEEEEEEEGVEEAEAGEGEDAAMGGVEDEPKASASKDADDASEAGSEDLEAESEGSEDEEDDEEEEDEEGEREGEDGMDTTEDGPQRAQGQFKHQVRDVMVH